MHRLNPKEISRLLILTITIMPWGLAIAPAKSETMPVRSISELTPLPQPSGGLQDLQQLENRSPLDWSWQDAMSQNSQNSQKEETPYSINANTGPLVNPIQEFEEWKRLNQGDPKRDSPAIPLTQF